MNVRMMRTRMDFIFWKATMTEKFLQLSFK